MNGAFPVRMTTRKMRVRWVVEEQLATVVDMEQRLAVGGDQVLAGEHLVGWSRGDDAAELQVVRFVD